MRFFMRKIFFFITALIIISAATTFVYHRTRQADINYYRGYRLSKQGEFVPAIKFYEQALAINPSRLNVDIKTRLAEAYIWNKQFEEAKAVLSEISKISPENKKIKLLLARAMRYSGQAKQAIEIYKELLATNLR